MLGIGLRGGDSETEHSTYAEQNAFSWQLGLITMSQKFSPLLQVCVMRNKTILRLSFSKKRFLSLRWIQSERTEKEKYGTFAS